MSELCQIGPFRGDQKPVRNGVYKRWLPFDPKIIYSRYEKGHWYDSGATVMDAEVTKFVSFFQDSQWWGVLHD